MERGAQVRIVSWENVWVLALAIDVGETYTFVVHVVMQLCGYWFVKD